MAKKQTIRGKRLLLIENIAGKNNELSEVLGKIQEHQEALGQLRTLEKILRKERNELIRTAINKSKVPPIRIGERLGLAKSSIHLIRYEKI